MFKETFKPYYFESIKNFWITKLYNKCRSQIWGEYDDNSSRLFKRNILIIKKSIKILEIN